MTAALAFAAAGLGVSAWLFRLVMIWPGQRHPTPPRPPMAMAELGLIALGLQLMLMLLAPHLIALLEQAPGPSGGAGTPPAIAHGMLVTVCGNLAIVLSVLAIGRFRHGLGPQRMGLNRPSRWSLPLATLLLSAAVPAFIGASLLNAEIIESLGWESHQALVRALLEDDGLRTDPLLMTSIVLVVPLLEEVLFRGFLQSAIRVALGPVPAVLVTSLLFAVVHDTQSILPVFVIGLTLGVIFERTGSVWASAWAHALFNGAQIAIISSLGP